MKRSTRKSSVGFSALRTSVGNFTTRFSSPSFVDGVSKLTAEQRNAIKKAGFGNLLLIPNQTINRKLLVELLDRWSSERRAFVFPHGEITITLLDVALITGLPVSGNPVLLEEDQPLSGLEMEFGATPDKRKITVSSLESRLDSLGGTADADFVRTFLLFIFGTFLFPNSSGNVDTRYLSLLRSLDDIHGYAWGGAVLEEMLMWLNKRKDSNIQFFGGCLTFLQIWSFEHLDIARPSLLDDMAFPRACRWENRKPNPRQSFTAIFEELKADQIIWMLQPTAYELELDVVRETMKVKRVGEEELPKTDCSSPLLMVAKSAVVLDIDTEKDISEAEEVNEFQPQERLNEPDILSDNDSPSVSSNRSELPNGSLELLSTSRDGQLELRDTMGSVRGSEEDLRSKYQILQEHVLELQRQIHDLKLENMEINDLRLEIELLKEQSLSIPLLEEENCRLKEEVASLKRECKNLSAFDLVVQLEKVVSEYDSIAGEGT